jgi:hypothetical protein
MATVSTSQVLHLLSKFYHSFADTSSHLLAANKTAGFMPTNLQLCMFLKTVLDELEAKRGIHCCLLCSSSSPGESKADLNLDNSLELH